MVAKPRDWLKEELDASLAVNDLQLQIQTQVQARRAAQMKLNALMERNEQASNEMASLSMAAAEEGVEAVCSEAAASREAEAEALRAKLDYHNTELQKLNGRLIRCTAEEKLTERKIDRLVDIAHSK